MLHLIIEIVEDHAFLLASCQLKQLPRNRDESVDRLVPRGRVYKPHFDILEASGKGLDDHVHQPCLSERLIAFLLGNAWQCLWPLHCPQP